MAPGDRTRRSALGGGAIPARFVTDPLSGETAELRTIQPIAATKAYRCPGCNQEIAVGVGHVVVVPLGDPGGRRHWHHACWQHRGRRRPGRPS
ncbi:MAG: hypothetical protein M0014_07355 [Actinomycetota bacterium]|jgi:hypothetical protein|nr:hypothetical protein [Actinomycetota bacterium]